MEELSRDEMLERLQAQRRRDSLDQRIFTKRSTFFACLGLVMFAILAIMILRTPSRAIRTGAQPRPAEHWKQLADRLKAKGLPEAAARFYEKYLETADISPTERANVSYVVAKLSAQARRYENALAWLTEADLCDPNAPIRKDADRLQRLCFERLGRPLDADYQLAASASLNAHKANPRGAVVATIGNEKVTMGDIDDAIQALPKFAREAYSKPGKKAEFIQQHVANRILYRKAKNLGFDKDPKVRKQIEAAQANIVVQAFLEKEVDAKIDVTDSELQLYYKVHQADYSEPAQVRIAHILVDDEKQAAGLIAKAKAGADFAGLAKQHSKDADTRGAGGEIAAWLRAGGTLRDLPQAKGLDALFALQAGQVAPKPIHSDRGWHVVKVIQKKSARVKPLSEVRTLVERAYRAQKQQERLANILKEAREKLNVQLYPEAMAADAPVLAAPKTLKVK